MFAQGIPPPFLLYTSHPRTILALSNSRVLLTSHDLIESVVMIERSNPEEVAIDDFLTALETKVYKICQIMWDIQFNIIINCAI